jgi:hypothetical protein
MIVGSLIVRGGILKGAAAAGFLTTVRSSEDTLAPRRPSLASVDWMVTTELRYRPGGFIRTTMHPHVSLVGAPVGSPHFAST